MCRLDDDDTQKPVLQLKVIGLGTELKLRTFDMSAHAFLREVCLLCPEYIGKYLLYDQKLSDIVKMLKNLTLEKPIYFPAVR